MRARDDNRRAVDEACELNAACLVLVVGGLPGGLQGKAEYHDIGRARAQVTEGIAQLLEYARERKMPIAIEPLHPMYAADRACINTLEQALDVCDLVDPARSGEIGVAVDLYHVWWDPKLQAQIERAGQKRLLAFHVCDWLTPTTDLLNDRGMMGDGVIEIPEARGWVEGQGSRGSVKWRYFRIGGGSLIPIRFCRPASSGIGRWCRGEGRAVSVALICLNASRAQVSGVPCCPNLPLTTSFPCTGSMPLRSRKIEAMNWSNVFG